MKTDSNKLKNIFFEETDTPATNSQGEPDIDYVAWLENRIIGYCSSPVSVSDEEKAIEYGDYVQMDDRFETVHVWSKELEKRNAGRWTPKKITKEQYIKETTKP